MYLYPDPPRHYESANSTAFPLNTCLGCRLRDGPPCTTDFLDQFGDRQVEAVYPRFYPTVEPALLTATVIDFKKDAAKFILQVPPSEAYPSAYEKEAATWDAEGPDEGFESSSGPKSAAKSSDEAGRHSGLTTEDVGRRSGLIAELDSGGNRKRPRGRSGEPKAPSDRSPAKKHRTGAGEMVHPSLILELTSAEFVSVCTAPCSSRTDHRSPPDPRASGRMARSKGWTRDIERSRLDRRTADPCLRRAFGVKCRRVPKHCGGDGGIAATESRRIRERATQDARTAVTSRTTIRPTRCWLLTRQIRRSYTNDPKPCAHENDRQCARWFRSATHRPPGPQSLGHSRPAGCRARRSCTECSYIRRVTSAASDTARNIASTPHSEFGPHPRARTT